jgi:hypothetical protein
VKLSNSILIFLSNHEEGSTCFHRYDAIKSHFVKSYHVDNFKLYSHKSIYRCHDYVFFKLFKWSLNNIYADYFVQKSIKDICEVHKNESILIWSEKTVRISPSVFLDIRRFSSKIIMCHYSLDDVYQKHHLTRRYINTVPVYDFHITTKSFNVDELYALGAKRVLTIANSFSEKIHSAQIPNKKCDYDVVFGGEFENERADTLFNVIASLPCYNFYIFGSKRWSRFVQKKLSNITIITRPFYGTLYSANLKSGRVALIFLRKENRDLQTQRSVEIPAMRIPFIAEYSTEHEELYGEDSLFCLFKSDDDLVNKLKYILDNYDECIVRYDRIFKKIASENTHEKVILNCINEIIGNYS